MLYVALPTNTQNIEDTFKLSPDYTWTTGHLQNDQLCVPDRTSEGRTASCNMLSSCLMFTKCVMVSVAVSD